MSETDILIIGAGPTGLALALELSLQLQAQAPNPPFSFRIIDTSPTPTPLTLSRALVLHSRTLELLSRHPNSSNSDNGVSITDELLSLGRLNMGLRFFINKKEILDIQIQDLAGSDSIFSTPLMLSQGETEAVLERALGRRYGKVVERGVTASRVEQDDQGVTAWLRKSDGSGTEEKVRCKYTVGCDGAHSIVRKAANLAFSGGTYPQDFILADVYLRWEMGLDVHLFMGSEGFSAVLPMKGGLCRLICSRPAEMGSEAEPTIRDFEAMMSRLTPRTVEIFDPPVWITRFRLHYRIAERYRARRMFLAGDAAHIHSPVGGQGMNAGMQDSVNLGWKLAAVIRGQKDEDFLDTYNLERHKIGEYLLRGTDRAFEFFSTGNPLLLWLRNTLVPWIAPWIMSDRSRRASCLRFLSQLGIRYRESPIVGNASEWNGALRGGDRAPDGKVRGLEGETNLLALSRGPGYQLMLFSGTGSEALDGDALEKGAIGFREDGNGLVKIHKIFNTDSTTTSDYIDQDGAVYRLYGFTGPGYVLVRPDGYISFIGSLSSIEELKVWMKK